MPGADGRQCAVSSGWCLHGDHPVAASAHRRTRRRQFPHEPLDAIVSPELRYTPSCYAFARPDYDAGSLPHSVAVGDFDGDADLDLAVANDLLV